MLLISSIFMGLFYSNLLSIGMRRLLLLEGGCRSVALAGAGTAGTYYCKRNILNQIVGSFKLVGWLVFRKG